MTIETKIAKMQNDATHYSGSDLEALLTLRRYRSWIMDEIAGFIAGRTLEVGAGVGSFSPHILAHASHLDMIEPSERLSQVLSGEYADHPRMSLFRGTAESWLAENPREDYETVVMINVLEHIEEDAAVVREFFRILRPGGHLVLFVPALPFLYSRLDSEFGHFRRYDMASLRKIVEAAGFQVSRAMFFDLLGVFPWWLINKKMGCTSFNPTLVGVYDAIGVPLTRTLERWWRPPFGKNIVMVGQRPSS